MPHDRKRQGAGADDSVEVERNHLPGPNIRRLQKIAVAVFLQETDTHGITPVPQAARQAIGDAPGIDQRGRARAIGFDTSTLGGVIDRLEAHGLTTRHTTPEDRRACRLGLSAAGRALLCAAAPPRRRSCALRRASSRRSAAASRPSSCGCCAFWSRPTTG